MGPLMGQRAMMLRARIKAQGFAGYVGHGMGKAEGVAHGFASGQTVHSEKRL